MIKTTLTRFSPLLLLFLCYLNSFSFAASAPFLDCLSSRKIPPQQLANITYTPKSTNYTSVLQEYIRNSRFNTSTTPKPTLILTPFLESQVQDIVTCAKISGIQLKIRSGGHDYEGLSYTSKSNNPFIVLDLFNLRSIDINLEDETAWVEAGATLGELYYSIWQKSKVHAFPAGVCTTLGIGGHFSGGGYGNLMRKFGLSVDNVVDAKIVDANGRILDRKAMGEDLFWAIRGGGAASFGVVLAFKINLIRVPPEVTVFRVTKTLEENATDLVHRWQYIADKFDKDLFVRVFLQTYAGEKNKTSVRASFIALFLGDANKLVALIKSGFPELGLKKEECKEISWIRSVLYFADYPEGTPETALLVRKSAFPSASKMKSDYVKTPIPKDGLREALNRMAASGNIWMQFNPYGGRMGEIPEAEIPFPHRAGNIFKIQYLVIWNEAGGAAVEKSNIENLSKFYQFMTPYVSKNPREAFLNYRDINIGSTDNGGDAYEKAKVYGIKYFKGNFDRLVQVKTKVDPTNLFRNEQSIPTLRK
ncbi:berberine bridge enzyme-like 8 [Sesamum indicum]|uniref:Berberine bridge enzyme-like 8 n=1 Tax=Sesamum indicum TaxID=4182 RepID=A0A6I9TQ63_SESIN|nr:berberine bridge enzyme-like 8 [Sesamum indicum]